MIYIDFQVLPGLYVGNYRDSKDSVQLNRYNITHIIAIHDAARKLHHVSRIFVIYRKLNEVSKNLSQDILTG